VTNRVLLVDGLNTFFRSYATNPVTDNNGTPVGGLVGSLRSIGAVVRDLQCTQVIVVFDGKGGSSRRRKIFPNYKKDRKMTMRMNRQIDFDTWEEKEQNMKAQLIAFGQYLDLLPIKVMAVDNVEADDVIAYITLNYFKDDEKIIMSSDKDFLQLVDEKTKVWAPTKKKLYGIDEVIEEYHIHPYNITINRILDGDKSDNIDGIKGFGVKRLAKIFPFLKEEKKYELDDIKEYAEQNIEKFGLLQKLVDNYDIVERNNELMNLHLCNFSMNAKMKIQSFMNEEPKKLNKMELLLKFNGDGLSHAFKNFPEWVSKTFVNVRQ
jgi:5'-3' exonuclease